MQVTIKVPYTRAAICIHRQETGNAFKEAVASSTELLSTNKSILEYIAIWHDIPTEVVVSCVNFQQLVEMYILKTIRENVTTLSNTTTWRRWGEVGVWAAVIDAAQQLFPEVEIEFQYEA